MNALPSPATPTDCNIVVQREIRDGPPYQSDLRINNQSNFADNKWYEQHDNLAAGNRNRDCINFVGHCETRYGQASLDERKNSLLITQLKDFLIGFKHHRYVLKDDFYKTYPAWMTLVKALTIFRKLFIGAAIVGLDTIAELDQDRLDQIIDALNLTNSGRISIAEALDHLMRLANANLVSQCGPLKPMKITTEIEIDDTTVEIGAQPLLELEINETLNVSLNYIDNYREIAKIIRNLNENNCTDSEALTFIKCIIPLPSDFSSSNLKSTLVSFMQVAASNLIGLHIGPRPSELLSIKRGFVKKVGSSSALIYEHLTLELQTYKAIKQTGGSTRQFEVADYMQEVADALETVMEAAGAACLYLFSDPSSLGEYNTNNWNYRLEKFCRAHNFKFRFTGRSWRTSLVSVMTLAIDNPLPALLAILNHRSKDTATGYAFASPFYREDFIESIMGVYRRRYKTLFEGTIALGGPGLGGHQGTYIERNIGSLFSVDVTDQDMNTTMDEYIEELIKQDIFPTLIRPGVFCVKGQKNRGVCSTKSGDSLPDPAKCSCACDYQTQTALMRETLAWEVDHMNEKLNDKKVSRLQKHFWARDILERVEAWPVLATMFATRLEELPDLKVWFPNFRALA